MNKGFRFWCPIEKSHTTDPNTGEVRMVLGGIASTADKDSDGEYLDPNGFDITPLMTKGIVNWHHGAKNEPSAVIGEPILGEIRPEGLYLETLLYPSSKIARDVWELANALERDSKTRRLGYSIEGKVLQRASEDPASPDYKRILKAVITGVAVTHQPKNSMTFANIIKGEVDEDFEEDYEDDTDEVETEKSMDTATASALRKESLQRGVRTALTKAEVFVRVLEDIPDITLEKAEKIVDLINKIASMKKKPITNDDISKAYEALGLQPIESESSLIKGEDENDMDDEDAGDEDIDDEDVEDDDEDDEGVTKGLGLDSLNRIEKAIAASHLSQTKYIKALGVLIKAERAKTEELSEIIKAQNERIDELQKSVEAYGSGVPSPKSLTNAKAYERDFGKGEDAELEKGGDGKTFSMSKQRQAVSDILDQATFIKGYDEEFSKACLSFEANKSLPANIIARLKAEHGITIVQ